MTEAICFLSTLSSMGEYSHSCCEVGNCRYQCNICFFSALGFSLFHLAYCKRESSSLFFVDFIVVVEEIYTSVAWTYNHCFLQLAHCCFSCTTIPKLFSHFLKASTSYGYFHYASYDIFAHWFSLNQMFKFSVSFATEVEKKNRPSHECFNRGLRSTKDLKRATGQNKKRTWFEIPVVIMENLNVSLFI